MKRSILAAALALLLLPAHSQAVPILVDNFDTENGGVGVFNYGGFANFTVSDGTVDLIGTGFFDLIPGNGLYVDLDGTSSDAGVMTSDGIALGPGNYLLSFDLAGSQRGDINFVDVVVFGGLSPNYGQFGTVLASADPFSTFSIAFSLLAADTVGFGIANGGGDNFGALLDRVVLESVDVSEVPEPGTLLLMGAGLAIAARQIRRRRA